MKRILFLGTHGQKNWGDELLLHVFMHQLRSTADKFYVNSYDPALTAAYLNRPDITVFHTKADKLKLLGYLFACDALVFGGGNILKELYTAYGGSRYATLGAVDSLTRAAKLLGKPIYLSNIGIGPVETDEGRQIVQRIVERARLTTVRDSESRRILDSLQTSAPYQQTSDAVWSTSRGYFELPATRTPRAVRGIESLRTIGVNLCRNISNNQNWSYFVDQLATDLLQLHRQNPTARFVGIPMQFDVSDNNDSTTLEELAWLVRASAPGVDFSISAPRNLHELAATIDSVDMLLAERLHALILGMVIGVPVVAMEYDIKITGLVKDLGLNELGIDINQHFKPGSFLRAITAAAKKYHQHRAAVASTYTVNHEQATLSFAQLKEALAPWNPAAVEPQFLEEEG